ncbi:enoyl-CoA hydratase/isomerase family protein [Mycobacterium sp. IS-1556]|uniref:enoyl-CoA hydratase/isomerase family protein n=1 Tax=Mycobacterium sp. IS-1556 TaxID=1772276 RepID=UPI0007402830|nr:enoyl-CoA hydratase/isomerase family protein [Mycobacterium sp. IS-1556]KUH83118.1 hypothetical protein AU185_04880 [Mycobacterium sp. GA-0227b]KUH89393.1 hypothetical protein AU187_09745 [Mycobacterium sp. IS-1556]
MIVERTDDHLLLVRLNRPRLRNAIGGTIPIAIHRALDDAQHDDDIHAVVLGATGDHFCAGADLTGVDAHGSHDINELVHAGVLGGDHGLGDSSPNERRLDPLGPSRLAVRFLTLDKPIVAALHGAVVGGGLSLALLADVRVAAEDSRFSAGYIDAGLGPELGLSWLLPRIAGHGAAVDLLIGGSTIGAAEAHRLRIADRLVGPGQAWDAAVELARKYAAQPSLAAQLTKRALRSAWTTSVETHMVNEWTSQRFLFTTDEFLGRLTAFQERHRAGRQQSG